jgi:hypothetical protein
MAFCQGHRMKMVLSGSKSLLKSKSNSHSFSISISISFWIDSNNLLAIALGFLLTLFSKIDMAIEIAEICIKNTNCMGFQVVTNNPGIN